MLFAEFVQNLDPLGNRFASTVLAATGDFDIYIVVQ